MQPNQPGPYNFILNEQPSPKHGFYANMDKSTKRILRVLVGLVGLIILIVIISIIASSGKGNIAELYQIEATQQDIYNIANLCLNNCQDQQLINQAANTQVILTTQANDLSSYLNSLGIKKISQQINRYLNNQAVIALNTADNNGQFETNYVQIYANNINAYREQLQTAYSGTKSQKLKNLLANDYNNTNVFVVNNSNNN